jgi:hypothetical protein
MTKHVIVDKEDLMNVRAICEGHFLLPLPLAEAVPLFTPEGERLWAGSSWDPIYAIPEAARDHSAPGTVFTTESTGGSATWIVLERSSSGMRYARVAPGRIAGTITVTCTETAEPGQTRVSVTYDVTSLSPEGAVFVEELEATYEEFLEDWRQQVIALGAMAIPSPEHGASSMTAARDRVNPRTPTLEKRRER